jgi:hypothetical protein
VPAMPRDVGRAAPTSVAGSLTRRREEILQSGNYTELVREYLQEMFVNHGLDPAMRNDPSQTLPKVTVTGREAKTIRSSLCILWEVAFDPQTKPISYSRWKELEPMLDAVQRAAEDGRWHFTTGELA